MAITTDTSYREKTTFGLYHDGYFKVGDTGFFKRESVNFYILKIDGKVYEICVPDNTPVIELPVDEQLYMVIKFKLDIKDCLTREIEW